MTNLDDLRDQILAQKPTDQQEDAIFAEELEFLLRAAPGSGKTWTSSRRFIWRGANWPYSAGGLALLSFTNTAIREFQEATIKVGLRGLLSDPNYVGTFDSFVERFILTPFGHLVVGSPKRPKLFLAPRPGDRSKKKLIAWAELKGGKKLQVPAWEIIPFPHKGKVAFKASTALGGMKLELRENNPVKELMSLGFYTHPQRVYWAWRILSDHPHIARVIARRFPEIIVDEAQDTNVWLLVILNLLRTKGAKITLVGDPDQCIYEFSMANAGYLSQLKERWGIPEKPLSQSFRCNNQIAGAVLNIGGNQAFTGCGDGSNEHRRAFIVRDPGKRFAHSVARFQELLDHAGIDKTSTAIICRAHQQLEDIRGEVTYTKLKGLTARLARASFFRDCHKDYKKAFQIVESSLRSITEDSGVWDRVDESSESEEAQKVKMAIWRFVKSDSGLPPVSLCGSEWISQLRNGLEKVISNLGVENAPNINLKIKKTGLNEDQMKLALFDSQGLFPPIRQETIHHVKGESIDGVLVLGSARFWNSVVDSVITGTSSEDRRLAYVAMTRARHVVALGLPASHYDNHAEKWIAWGFSVL
ncbi:MAG: ATP-dependent helicase [Acidobacteriota bacterium]